MSLRDDTIIRDAHGRIVKGSPGLHRKQEQAQPPPDQDPPSADFDQAIINAAHSFGSGSRVKVGLAGYCASLRDTRPVEYATLLSKALARKAETSTGGGGYIANIYFSTAPTGMYIDENGKLQEAADARQLWQTKSGHTDEPPPPSRPTLVPREEPADNEFSFGGGDDDDDEPAA